MTESAQVAAAVRATLDAPAEVDPAFDPAAFEELAHEIGQEGAAEVREVFKGETEARLRRFRSISPTQERSQIEREAHSLKSAAGSFGYRRLAKLALQLEKHAAQLTEAEYLGLLQQMDAAFAEAPTQEVPR